MITYPRVNSTNLFGNCHTGGNPVYLLAGNPVAKAKDPELASYKLLVAELKKRMNEPNRPEKEIERERELMEMFSNEIAEHKQSIAAAKALKQATKVRKQIAKKTKIQKQKGKKVLDGDLTSKM